MLISCRGYIYLMMGVIIGGAVLPASLTLLWDRQSWAAATFSPIIALACALIGWLVQAKSQYGDLSIDSTGSNYPMLVGNVVALLTPLVTVPVLSLIFRTEKYDWVSMKMIRRGDDTDLTTAAHVAVHTEKQHKRLQQRKQNRNISSALPKSPAL